MSSSSRNKRDAPRPLPAPVVVVMALQSMHAVGVVTTAMARDAMPPPLEIVRPSPRSVGHAIAKACPRPTSWPPPLTPW